MAILRCSTPRISPTRGSTRVGTGGAARGHLVQDVELPGHLHRLDVQFTAPGEDVETRDALEILDSALDAWAGYLTPLGVYVDWPVRPG